MPSIQDHKGESMHLAALIENCLQSLVTLRGQLSQPGKTTRKEILTLISAYELIFAEYLRDEKEQQRAHLPGDPKLGVLT